MTFTHLNKLGDFELEANTIDGVRYYDLPNGKKAPSITSVTSFYNRQIFINWRKKVGEETANKITKVSTDRGTRFHDLVEKYLLNQDIDTIDGVLPTTKALFIDTESAERMLSPALRTSESTVFCFAGKPSIFLIDSTNSFHTVVLPLAS